MQCAIHTTAISPRYDNFVDMLAIAAALPLTYLNHLHARTASTTILLLWPIYLLCSTLRLSFTATVSDSGDMTRLILIGSSSILCLVFFAIECLGMERGDKTPECIDRHESPFVTANVFSIWSFSWLSQLMKRGSSAQISLDDIYLLDTKNTANSVGEQLLQARKHWSV